MKDRLPACLDEEYNKRMDVEKCVQPSEGSGATREPGKNTPLKLSHNRFRDAVSV